MSDAFPVTGRASWPGALRRNLGAVEAVGVALAMVGPTLTMAIGTTLVVGSSGTAAPLTFLIGLAAMAAVGVSFAALGRRVASAGSARDYVGLVFGPRAGFLVGWALLLTYSTFASGAMAVTGGFAAATLAQLGVRAPHLWPWLGAGSGLLVAWLCLRDVRVTGRAMLVLEWVSMLALLVLAVVVLARVPLSASPFRPAPGHGWSGVGRGLVFAVLAFAGFEGAATLGEETRDPHRVIPVAILGTLAAAGLFYVLLAYAQVVGFGPAGMAALAQDASPLATLSRRFLSPRFATLVNLAATTSAFSLTTGTLAAASRVLFSFSRSGLLPALATVSRGHGVPGRAILAITAAALLGLASVRHAPDAIGYFGDIGTVGTLSLILVYLSVTGAGLALAWRERRAGGAAVGLAGLLLLLWPLANSVYPVPDWPHDLWPCVVAAWLGVGLLLAVVRPSLARRPDRACGADAS